jgi:hypothetical protein
MGDQDVEVGPTTGSLKIKGHALDVWVTKWEDIASGGSLRRRILAVAGVVGAALVLFHAAETDDWGPHLSTAGIILDIAGASLLATGLMLPTWASREMASPRHTESKSVRTYWEQTSLDARLAFALLLVGFLLQALSSVLASR